MDSVCLAPRQNGGATEEKLNPETSHFKTSYKVQQWSPVTKARWTLQGQLLDQINANMRIFPKSHLGSNLPRKEDPSCGLARYKVGLQPQIACYLHGRLTLPSLCERHIC